MRRFLRRVPPIVVGVVIGVTAAMVAERLASPEGGELAFTVLIVLSVALAGLLLGAFVALVTLIAGTVTLIVLTALDPVGVTWAYADYVRVVAFVIGAPAIVYLVHRSDVARRRASAALERSRAAERAASDERAAAERTRLALDRALTDKERERARLEEVAEAIPEPLIVYDDEPRGTYGNRAAMRLFGRSFVERPLDEWARTADPRDEQGTALEREDWPQVVAQARPLRRRMLLRIPMSGRDVLVDVEGTPIPGGGAVLLLRDVGKEEDARRRLSRFASFVAHELRNPLAVAKARIELALRDTSAGSRAANHSNRALDSVDAAIAMLERLELYSRAESGTIEASSEPFDLGPALGSAIERLRSGGTERDVTVVLAPGVRVTGDRQLSEQAMTNLLTNADRYATPDTPIRVEVEAGEVVTLRVIDAGPGIDDDTAARLFHERVTGGRGLGLGLYLVHAAMEAMGGSVSLERRRPGAVFALRWPAAEAAPRP